MKFLYAEIILALTLVSSRADENSPTEFKCLDTSRHKPAPSEENLSQCTIYKENSCCKNETANRIYGTDLYYFNKMLCNKSATGMSPKCKEFFLQDACFYECSPHIASWSSPSSPGGVRDIPLCKSNCDDWFLACSNEFTCSDNWQRDHEIGDFSCASGHKCQTVKDKFKSSEEFCTKVWDQAYKVVPDDDQCVRFNLKSDVDKNKNRKAAEDKEAKDSNSSSGLTYNFVLVSIPIVAGLLGNL